MKIKVFNIIFFFLLFNYKSYSQELLKVNKNDFPIKESIKGDQILTNDYNHHHKIYVVDKYLLTLVNTGDFNYHIFDKRTQQYIGPIGKKGEGPDEWIIPQTTLGQFEKRGNEIFLWYYDYLRGAFSLMNLTKTLDSKSISPIVARKLRINMKVFPYFQLFMGENNKIYASSWIYEQDRSRLKSYNLLTKEISKSGLFPKILNSSHLPSETMNSLYTAAFQKHPNKDFFVQALFVFNRIDIFDSNLKLVRSIVDGENWIDNYYNGKEINPADDFIGPRMNGYNGVSVSENFIFALELKENLGLKNEKENESFIRVFNWEGNPLAYFKVDNDLSSISFDESEGFLYATDYSHELVLKFNLKKYLNQWKK